MTAVVKRWQEARGEAEPPEHANELTSMVVADLGIAAPRIDEEPRDQLTNVTSIVRNVGRGGLRGLPCSGIQG